MKLSRALVAAVSGFGYPSVVAVVAAGVLTFTTARVFAEAATLPSCSDSRFTECSGSSELAQCTNCGSSSCGCVRVNFCADEAGSSEPTTELYCTHLATCEQPNFTECAGKKEGEWCGPYRACAQTGCAVLDGGAWALTPSLACSDSQDAGPNPPVLRDGSTSTDASRADAGSPPTSAPSASDDSGCALAGPPGASTSGLAGAGALTLGMAFLWRLRRRRR